MKRIVMSVAMAMVWVLTASAQATPSNPAVKHHVVFDHSAAEGQAWDSLISHVTNMRAAFEKDGGSEVEVVFYGPGLEMVLKRNGKYEKQLKTLADAGVKLSACQNAMKFFKVKSEDLYPFMGEVDSGIAQIVRRQEQGWAVIK